MEMTSMKIIAEEFQGMDVAVCANLPYYITSANILMMLSEERLPIKFKVMVRLKQAPLSCAPMGTRDMGANNEAQNYFSVP